MVSPDILADAYYAEQVLLYALIIQADEAIPHLGELKPLHLTSKKYAATFEAVLAVWESGKKVDLLTVIRQIHADGDRGCTKAELLDILTDTLPVISFQSTCQNILENYKRRRLQSIGARLQQTDQLIEVDEAIAQVEDELAPLKSSDCLQNSPVPVINAFDEYFTSLENLQQGTADSNAVSTGFYDLDVMLNGGFSRGDLVVVAGRPAMGKSAWALQAGFNYSREKQQSTLFYSLEMPKRQLLDRLISQLCKIEVSYLASGRISQTQWEQILGVRQEMENTPLLIADNLKRNWRELEQEIRIQHTKSQGRLGLVIIDYLQLLVGDADDLVRELGKATRTFKLLAVELNIAIVLLSQLSRAVEQRRDRRPQLSDLRDSGAIEQDSDKVLALYRDEYYNSDTPDRGIAEMLILKHRTGPTGTVKLLFDSPFVQFKNLAKYA